MLKFSSQHHVVWAISILIPAATALAAKNDWAEGTPGRSTGATRDYYNAAGRLAWKNLMGDWRDARNVAQGKTAYATTTVADDDNGKFAEWDVTSLVREWQDGERQNQGFFLRTMNHGGTIVFCSREHAELVLSGSVPSSEYSADQPPKRLQAPLMRHRLVIA